MPNHIKHGTSSLSSLVKGNQNFGVSGFADYGPTSSSGFYQGITPPNGGYTIYVDRASGGPSIHVANNDTQCIFFLKSFGATGSTITEVLAWATAQTTLFVQSTEFTTTVTSYYMYGSPFMLFDFNSTSDYGNSGTAIKDLSGNSNDGTFVTGTGKGTTTTVFGYSSTAPARLNLNGSSSSVRLVNTAQFTGTQTHSMVAWIRLSGHAGGAYPGIFSSDQNPYGYEFSLTNESPKRLLLERFSAGAVVGNFGTDYPAFAYNTWYMVSMRYDGTISSIDIYMGGTRYTKTATIGAISTSNSYGPSMGLRYNNWIQGDYGYTAGYLTDIGTTGLDAIYNNTKSRYGY